MRHVLALAVLLTPLKTTAGDIERGKAVAERVCARCHAIDPARPWDSIGSTPSFMLMAKKLDSYEQRILSVKDRRPHIAQELKVEPGELEDVVRYIASIKM